MKSGKGKALRRSLWFALVSVLLFIGLLPSLVSTQVGTGLVMRLIGHGVAVEELSLSWLGSQRIKGLKIEGKLQVGSIETDVSLLSLLRYGVQLSRVRWEFDTLSWERLLPRFEGKIALYELRSSLLHLTAVEALSTGAQLSVSLEGDARQNDIEGKISLYETLKVVGGMATVEGNVRLVDFPMKSVHLEELVGPYLTLQLDNVWSAKTLQMNLQASAANVSAQIATRKENDAIILDKAGVIAFSLPPIAGYPLKGRLVIEDLHLPLSAEGVEYLKAKGKAHVELQKSADLQIEQLDVRSEEIGKGFSLALKGSMKGFSISAEGTNENLNISLLAPVNEWNAHFPSWKIQKIAPIHIALSSIQIPEAKLSNLSLIADLQMPEVVWENPLNIGALQAHLQISSLEKISLEWSSPLLRGAASLSLKGDELTFTKPLTALALLTPELSSRLFPEAPRLRKGAEIAIEIDELSTIRQTLSGNLNIAAIEWSDNEALEKISSSFSLNGKEEKARANLQGTMTLDGALAGSFDASLTLQGFSNPLIEADAVISDALLPGHFRQLVGDHLNAKVHLLSSQEKQRASGQLSSNRMHLIFDLAMQENHLELGGASPLELKWKITPESYPILDKFLTHDALPDVALSSDCTLAININRLWIPTRMNLQEWQVAGSLSLDRLALTSEKEDAPLLLKNLSAQFSKTEPDQPILLKIKAESNGKVEVDSRIQNLFAQNVPLLIDSDVAIEKLSSALLDALLRFAGNTDKPITAIFGSQISANGKLKMQEESGTMQWAFHSPTCHFSLDAKLAEGLLLLNDAFSLDIALTKELSKLLRKESNGKSPILYASHPITCKIAAEAFTFPFSSFDPKRLNASTMQINLDKIYCQDDDNLKITLSLLKARQLQSGRDLELWFTPMDLSINQGKVAVKRTDLLLGETYHVALWGDIDLAKDRVDLVLGLTASCLKKAFGIKKLPDDYVLQIPIKGSLSNIQINSSAATTKITALLAWQHKEVVGGLAGGLAGALVGEVLDLVGTLPDIENKAPPPTHPIPWQSASK